MKRLFFLTIGIYIILRLLAIFFRNEISFIRQLQLMSYAGTEIICFVLLIASLNACCTSKFARSVRIGIAIVGTAIYAVQFLFLFYTKEYIPILAFENLDQTYLLMQKQYILPVAITLAVGAVFTHFCLNYRLEGGVMASKKRISAVLVLFLIVSWQNSGTLMSSHKYGQIFKRAFPTPLAAFARRATIAFMPAVFSDYDVNNYPFQKDFIYKSPLPFPRKVASNMPPNIIILLTEGTSSRLLGCYGGRFDNLSPAIDEFSKQAMRIDNYYNHTAATFRGTLGQLASGFRFDGGGDTIHRMKKNGVSQVINYQTLPKILDKEYETLFFSPHLESDPYTDLLRMIGFQKVITREDISVILGDKRENVSMYAEDGDMYRSLRRFLERRADSGQNQQPFLAVMYTVGTHAGLDSPAYGAHYHDGSNPVLNTMLNIDKEFGSWWNWFKMSPYHSNTIVIFTADHSHYYEKPYLQLVENERGYKPYFCDAIPLIIYDPVHDMPEVYDAGDATSLALAPTVLHLIGKNNIPNSFLGVSLFDELKQPFHLYAMGKDIYVIYRHTVYEEKDIPAEFDKQFSSEKELLYKFYAAEQRNKIFR